ncbi:MAG TPA: hypothetical protein VH573_06370 [Mycobacteriales bacterium]|jgi:hypothetical protein
MLALAGIAATILAVGGVAVAAAATSDSTPSPSASAAPSPGTPSPGAPKPDRERHPFLAGTVVSASGNTITITDVQGFQRTIHTTSATTYEDGLTATPAAGTRIYAVGTVDTDKTSLKATKVGKIPDRPEGRGFPGRGFPGGPGRHHDGDGDKGASPSPTPSPTA